MPKIEPAVETFARIKVVGVGGAGGAAINRMVDAGISGVDFVAVNTDAQALHHSKAGQKIHIGNEITRGLGAGADPDLGQKAAIESADDIKKAVNGADMVFITFGGGGGTGSGAGPLVAKAAKDTGSLVVGFVTKPFAFEGEKRRRNADTAIEKLRGNVDTLITVPNDRLLQTIDRRTPLLEAFKVADDVLRQGVQGISGPAATTGRWMPRPKLSAHRCWKFPSTVPAVSYSMLSAAWI
jgi:cell division protein FtsZ